MAQSSLTDYPLRIWPAKVRKGLCKVKKFQQSELTVEVGGWVQVSLGKKVKSSQNTPIPVVLIF